MSKLAKMVAVVMAAMMVSGVARGDQEKVFVCKYTQVEFFNGSPLKRIDEAEEYKFDSFHAKGTDAYEMHISVNNGVFEVITTIDRKTGTVEKISGGKDHPDDYKRKVGSCELVVRKLELKF